MKTLKYRDNFLALFIIFSTILLAMFVSADENTGINSISLYRLETTYSDTWSLKNDNIIKIDVYNIDNKRMDPDSVNVIFEEGYNNTKFTIFRKSTGQYKVNVTLINVTTGETISFSVVAKDGPKTLIETYSVPVSEESGISGFTYSSDLFEIMDDIIKGSSLKSVIFIGSGILAFLLVMVILIVQSRRTGKVYKE